MAPRRSTIFLGTVAGLSLGLAGMLLHAAAQERGARQALARKGALVRQLHLTDLCLCTEASYTRHPSMTDFPTPFQDAPMSFEHFPTGAVIQPPPHLVTRHGAHD
ncbi:hypothetical protein [Geomonas azotofigens]|uniref:hypothetical protein n=1 Tax=Geomonas azotofigens TaxID=2843196 RepID=UPI001C1072E4|nr:hypothetical protein [Geomonas azotofigens]MBU5614189.1 hypothetical protein [Geomonas azotofigens]